MVWPCTREYVKQLGYLQIKYCGCLILRTFLAIHSLRCTMACSERASPSCISEALSALWTWKISFDVPRFCRTGNGIRCDSSSSAAEPIRNRSSGRRPNCDCAMWNFRVWCPSRHWEYHERRRCFCRELEDVPLLRFGISLNKVCDYLASGRPTIFAGSPDMIRSKKPKPAFPWLLTTRRPSPMRSRT